MDADDARLQSLGNLDDHFGRSEMFAPGTYGCHEALHMASVLAEQVDAQLLEHAAIIHRPDWYQLAWTAQQALMDLYQAIGAEHMNAPTLIAQDNGGE